MSASREKKSRQGKFEELTEKQLKAREEAARAKRNSVVYTIIGVVCALLVAALLTDPAERALIKALSLLPDEIHQAAKTYDPSRINRYLVSLAGDFHRFYNACRIKGEEPAVLAARLKLADSVRSVIANCLDLLGVSAPEKM